MNLVADFQDQTALRAWTRLPSGRRLDLINPDPQAWSDEDLAVRLSRTYRWAGESKWPHPLSVAQHSLLVLTLVQSESQQPLSAAKSLRETLHDAEEGFLGFDCISPLKRSLGEPFERVSARLMNAVSQRYGLPAWNEQDYRVHKRADRAAAAAEALHCVGWSVDEIRDVLGIDAPILDVDPLAKRYDANPWEPWPSQVAAECFLAELREQRQAQARQV